MKRIAQITDIHLDEEDQFKYGVDPRKNWEWILQDVARRGIETIVFTGDIGEPAALDWFLESLEPFEFTVLPGNHDTFREVTKKYNPPYLVGKTEMYHSVTERFFKYIFLDTSTNELSEIQLGWLADELNSEQKILLFIHHPVLAVDTILDKKYPLLNRDKVRAVLEGSEKEITIFCGHYHTEDFAQAGNIRQYVTPGASVQYDKHPSEVKANNSFFGYRIIEIEKEEIRTNLIIKDNNQ